ncbi:MAG: GntR family transcriptional regulator [Acidimicrobiales bacterium]
MSDQADLSVLLDDSAGTGRGQTAHVYVRETLRMSILNGQLPGGTRLVQSDIAKQLDVSTTPVREALRDLTSEGLIEMDPHRGGMVAELDRDDLAEVYQIRRRLETMALELAMPQITEEELERLDELHAAMTAAPNSATWVQLNREFHMTIYQAARMNRLVPLIKSLQDASVMAVSARIQRVPEMRQSANDEHGQLLDAIKRQNLDEAIAVLQYHLSLSIRD